VKLHPVASGLDLTPAGVAVLDEVIADIQRRGLVTLLHANFEDEASSVAAVRVAQRHALRPIVLAHAFTRPPPAARCRRRPPLRRRQRCARVGLVHRKGQLTSTARDCPPSFSHPE
jgi:hypothetical protein